MTPQIITAYVIMAVLILAVSGFFAFIGYRIWHNNPIEAFKSLFRVNEERFHADKQLRVRAGFFYILSLYLLFGQVFNFLKASSKYSTAIFVIFVLVTVIYGIVGHLWAKKK